MHVSHIRLENIRGFREVDLDLRRPDGSLAGWTVFAGRNGSGKSTLLQGIAVAGAGPGILSHFEQFGFVRLGEQRGKIDVLLVPGHGDVIQAHVRNGYRFSLEIDPDLKNHRAVPADRSLWPYSAPGQGWLVLGYGPTRRVGGHGADARRILQGAPEAARLASLFREDVSLVESLEWLQDINYRKLDGKPGQEELEQQVITLLNHGLLPGGVQIRGVNSDGVWVEQNGVELQLDALSDGYRITAALVMDLVRHLHHAFGELDVRTSSNGSGRIAIHNSGVVLIDEVELHLHVSWQQRIGFWLKEHFPNIQFLVTTHSPFVCQAADPGGLIRLSAPGDPAAAERVPEEVYRQVVHGSIDDAVLSELFGLESPYSDETETLREQVARLEAKLQRGKASDDDREKLEALREQLPGHLGSEVEQVLRRLEVKG